MRLGCVEIPCDFGPLGHSDGDVLAHALCDALLCALALGDIGAHFPSDDPRWRGADSKQFVSHAATLVRSRGGRISNVDATIVLEKPKLAPHIPEIRRSLAALLGCEASRVSVKAKTAEGLGAIGEGRAVEARVVVCLEVAESPSAS